ncbi:MAG: DUF1861 family protein [Bacilli bacterium]|jgi:hypothetical protein|nr:DUF1861 family protein [Bacilli bacterium]
MAYAKLLDYIYKHRQNNGVISTKKLTFLGVDGYDVYNISHPFTFKGETYLAGRVEKRDNEISKTVIFKEVDLSTYQATNYVFDLLQDPFVEIIDDELFFGGTEIEINKDNQIISWRTIIFKGPSFEKLEKIIIAPEKMKDVRLFKDQEYYVFTRPQGGAAKRGKIGFAKTSSLKNITTEFIQNAPLIDDLFDDDIWGGVNQIHLLSNGLLGILGHVAMMSEKTTRHYYAMTFCFDPFNLKRSDMKIIAEKDDFGESEYKREDLKDVLFSGGLIRHKNKTASLYTGVNDCEGHVALIKDPFLEYEEE